MKLTKEQLLSVMKGTGIIPVFYFDDINVSKNVIDACYAGGVRVFEFTNRGPQAFSVFSSLVKHMEQYPDASLGIGTVIDNKAAVQFLDAGSHFVVSPIVKPEVGQTCNNAGVPWIPGCATLTEIVMGHEAGAALIKIFPASVLGPEFVKAIRPVVPSILLMPTGGVDTSETNLRSWFKAGVHCVGMGSQLLKSELVNERNWKELTQLVSNTINTIKNIER